MNFGQITAHKGFSLLEALMVVSFIGIVALIVIPDLTRMLFEYRLAIAVRQVSAAVHLARSRAIADNFNYQFALIPSEQSMVVSGGEWDTNGDGNLDPWEDRNNNGTLDANSFPGETLPTGITYVSDVSTLLPAIPSLKDTAPSTPVDYGTASASTVSFNPLGAATGPSVFYFRNIRNSVAAVTVDSSGRIQTWRYLEGTWRRS